MTRIRNAASGATAALGVASVTLVTAMPACGDRDPYVDQGFALIDEVVPGTFKPTGERSMRSDAIRVFDVPEDTDPVAALDIPPGYERDADTDPFVRSDKQDGVRTLASWEGPNPEGETNCALIVRVPAKGDRAWVEITANCSLGR